MTKISEKGIEKAARKLCSDAGIDRDPSLPTWRRFLPEARAAIAALIEKTLPGWAWKVGTCSVSDDAWLVPDFNDPVHGSRLLEQFGPIESGSIWDHGIDIDRRPPGHVSLALCASYCEARAAIEDAARVNGAASERETP